MNENIQDMPDEELIERDAHEARQISPSLETAAAVGILAVLAIIAGLTFNWVRGQYARARAGGSSSSAAMVVADQE
ncbi:MAG TPA: hypothetical protein P5328_00440 [Candidatus Paceibacterota bacterium]|nr:hypothetical protein [Candidatus Paceibacterota bacterium]HRZ34206.1 hypothetical protein [Candidatus Paceibacterota bacterium]